MKHDEHRLRAVLRRYLSPSMVDRALDDLRAVDSIAPEPAPLPALAPPTELELRRVERLARRRGMVVVTKGRPR